MCFSVILRLHVVFHFPYFKTVIFITYFTVNWFATYLSGKAFIDWSTAIVNDMYRILKTGQLL